MKQDLRRTVRAARTGRVASADFADRVLARIPAGARVCCYVALPGEPPTAALIEALLDRGDEVFLPIADERLEWVSAAASRPWLPWGVAGVSPTTSDRVDPAPDVIVVPALAVDEQGRRLGQGGGYYDRFVPLHPHARTIALLWTGEVLPDVAAEPHDITVDEWVLADG